MESLEALLIDFDGTIVNTEIANAKAYAKALENHGFSVPFESVLSTCIGRHWSKFLPDLLGESYSEIIGKRVADNKKHLYPDFFSEISLNMPLLILLQSMNLALPKALVTNASRESVIAILNKFNLLNLFAVIICQEDVKNPKPDPAGYLLATRLLKVNAKNCIAIEDSDTGILAASKAGLQTIRIS